MLIILILKFYFNDVQLTSVSLHTHTHTSQRNLLEEQSGRKKKKKKKKTRRTFWKTRCASVELKLVQQILLFQRASMCGKILVVVLTENHYLIRHKNFFFIKWNDKKIRITLVLGNAP